MVPDAHGPERVPLPDVLLSTETGIPLYLQLKTALRQAIMRGSWAEDDLLPSELAIAEHFAISRNTVRQALGELEHEGLLVRRRGRGTQVAHRRTASPWAMNSWDGLLTATRAHGVELVTEPLRVELTELPEWAAGRLGVRPGAEGILVERRRLLDGQVLNYSTNYLPSHLAAVVFSADLASNSLYESLHDALGITLHGASRMLEAVVLNDEYADLLDGAVGEPAVLIESVVWDAAMSVFDTHRVWHRTGVMRLEVNVSEQPNG